MGEPSPAMSSIAALVRSPERHPRAVGKLLAALTVVLGAAIAAPGVAHCEPQPAGLTATGGYTLCGRERGANCVIDGDTVIVQGVTVRIEDIDAPETVRANCASEATLGKRATNRLMELMNAAPVAAVDDGGRDEDRYGRKLRVLIQDGESVGGRLVREGLARPWTGRRQPWC